MTTTTFRDRAELGQRIIELRQESGVTQRELATALGIDQSAVSRVEKGERGLSVEELMRTADFFGTSVEALLSAERPPFARYRESDDADARQALARLDKVMDDFFMFQTAAKHA